MKKKGLLEQVKKLFHGAQAQPAEPCAQIRLQEIVSRCQQEICDPQTAQAVQELVQQKTLTQSACQNGKDAAKLEENWRQRCPLSGVISLLGQLPEAEQALLLLWPEAQQEEGRRQLVDALRHEAGNQALAAARVIPQLQDPLLVPLLLQALLNDTEYVTARVAEALAGCGTAAADGIAVLYQKEDCPCRPLLLEVLALMPAGSCKDSLIVSALQAPEAEVRQAAVALLGRWQVKDSLALLTPLLTDEDLSVRATLARTLGQIGGPKAVDLLCQLDAMGDWQVEQCKSTALHSLGASEEGLAAATARRNRKNRSPKAPVAPPDGAHSQQTPKDSPAERNNSITS